MSRFILHNTRNNATDQLGLIKQTNKQCVLLI